MSLAPIDPAAGAAGPAAGERPTPLAGRAALSRTTVTTLLRVLHAARAGWTLDGRVAAAARTVAADARGQGLTAGQMLVALKDGWAGLAEVRGLATHDAQALLAHLVTLSIRSYYGPPRPARARPVAVD